MDFGSGFIYRFCKDIYSHLTRNKRRLTHAERVDLRERWRIEIEEKIRERHHKKLRKDVIVRDVRRADIYPDIDKSKGISPWFKAGLSGTYHRGIQLLIAWESLVLNDDGTWRYPGKEENATVTAALIGYVKYENIQQINWDGDEFYGLSHIFCHFDEKKRQPYEMIKYCEMRDLDGWPYLSELSSYIEVVKNSKNAHTKRYYPTK